MDHTNFSKEIYSFDRTMFKRYFEIFPYHTINFLGLEKQNIFKVSQSIKAFHFEDSSIFNCSNSSNSILIFTELSEIALKDTLSKILDNPNQLQIQDFNSSDLNQKTEQNENDVINSEEEIFIRENGWLKKILINNINWIKVEGVYTHLACQERIHTLRNTAKCVFSKLPKGIFYQIHKCYYVNRNKIEAINNTSVKIGENILPIGRSFHKSVMQEIKMY